MNLLALLLVLQTTNVSPVVVPYQIQHMADVNVLVGTCGRYLPKQKLNAIDEAAIGAPPEAQNAIKEWREEGRQARLDRPHLYSRSICLRLFEAIGI